MPGEGNVGNILSQEEVDALLGALPPEEEAETEAPEKEAGAAANVVPYDFRRPHRVSREQLRLLQDLHETFARQMTIHMSSLFRARPEMEVMSLEQMTYEEYVLSLPPVSNLFLYRMGEEDTGCVLEVQPTLALAFIERILGGPGVAPEEGRELTKIEITLLTRLMEKAIPALREAWAPVHPMEPALRSYERNAHLMQLLPPTETVLVLTFQVILPQAQGMMTLCYPFLFLEPILGRLAAAVTETPGRRRQASPETRAGVQARLRRARLVLEAILGEGEITVGDFLRLRPGHVLTLDQSVKRPLLVRVGGRPKFLAHPGQVGRRRAIQVVGIVEEASGGEAAEGVAA
jgi:flagellar motor switch protein FliM